MLAAAVWVLATAAAHGAGLDGRWDLTTQTYEAGAGNLADPDRVLRLEFDADGTARISAGDGAPMAWPAFVNDDGPLPLEIVDRDVDLQAGTVRVHYRVRPAAGDPLVLDIEESYRVEAGGETLAGSMVVRFLRDGEPRGEYVLHRRFERRP